jgi:hypothetical protein
MRSHIWKPYPEKGQHVALRFVVIAMELWTAEQFCTIPVRYSATKEVLLSNVKQEIWLQCVDFC